MPDLLLGHQLRGVRRRHEPRDQVLAVIEFDACWNRQFSISTVKEMFLKMAGLDKMRPSTRAFSP